MLCLTSPLELDTCSCYSLLSQQLGQEDSSFLQFSLSFTLTLCTCFRNGAFLYRCPSLPMCCILCLVTQSCLTLCDPHGLQPIRLLCPWGFSRQEYQSGLPYPPPGDLPNPGIKPRSSTLQVDFLPSEPARKPTHASSFYLWKLLDRDNFLPLPNDNKLLLCIYAESLGLKMFFSLPSENNSF